jgi:hypothetical protein
MVTAVFTGWLTSVCTVWLQLNLEAGQELTHRYHHVTISKNGVPLDASKQQSLSGGVAANFRALNASHRHSRLGEALAKLLS